MSIASPTHHHIPGSTAVAAIVSAIVVGGLAALAFVLPHDASTQPVAPTSECTITSCDAGQHPVLPGRHDFSLRDGDKFHPRPDGASALPGGS